MKQYWVNGVALLIGLVFSVVLFGEFRANQHTIDDNKQLIANIYSKTLLAKVTEEVLRYPADRETLRLNWYRYEPALRWYNNGERRFPFYQKAANVSIVNEYLAYYRGQSAPTNIDTQRRINLIETISSAAQNGEQQALRQGLADFLNDKKFYHLTVPEEVISWLMLLEKNPDKWSTTVARQILLEGWPDGNQSIPSVLTLMLTRSHEFTREDIKLLQAITNQYAIDYQIDLRRANDYINLLDNTEPMVEPPSSGFWSYNDQVIVATSTLDYKVMPQSRQDLFKHAKQQLMSQGLLDDEQDLAFPLNKDQWYSLEVLPVQVQKVSLERAGQLQWVYGLVKLLLLWCLVFFMMFCYHLLVKRARDKEYRLTMREDFFNLISHELKTPIASISVMAQTVERRQEAGLPINDYPRRIINEADQMERMIDNILTLNQLNSGDLIRCEPIPLAQLIEDALTDFDEHSHVLQLTHHIEPSLQILGNRILLKLVMNNLFSNAVKYHEHDKAVLHCRYENGVLHVVDNGVGIAPDRWEVVFDRFYRESDQKSGVGIGLAMSRSALQAMGGELFIRASSHLGTHWALTLKTIDESQNPNC